MQGFVRATYILHDVKYLLTTSPDESVVGEWSNELRKGFLHGVSILFDILGWMQQMDLQLRQTSHHIDHEFEWESCFRLHISFVPVFSLVIKWCSTDRIVFIKAVRMIFKKLFEDQNRTGIDFVDSSIDDNMAQCLDYQVSSKPVAMHHPLTRLLAGLSIYMTKFELSFDSNEFDIMEKPSAIQMMEPSLRTTVFVAQIQAGMWRRNGHSLVEQVMSNDITKNPNSFF
jgi:E3 ubiquitin-protein ligase UBR2